MNESPSVLFDARRDALQVTREGVILWPNPASGLPTPCHVNFACHDGVFPAMSWVEPPLFGDPDVVDKVRACILSLPNDQQFIVAAERDVAINPIELTPFDVCPQDGLVERLYELQQAIQTPAMRQFVSDVFTLKPVFRGFWTAAAGYHHKYEGGLATHSLDVADEVRDVLMNKEFLTVGVAESDLATVAALLHDVGKTVSYNAKGFRTERARVLGHELLGVELLDQPLAKLRTVRRDLADALLVLLLGRTKYVSSPYRLEHLHQLIKAADRRSANTPSDW